MTDEFQSDFEFEDVQSISEHQKERNTGNKTTQKSRKRKKGTARCLDKIVKAIAFLLALFVLLLFAAGAYILYKMDKSFSMIALCVLIAGVSFSLITLFMIYAIGHIITQNNEILKRL